MKYDWSNLKKLYLSYCSVGDEGALSLSTQEWPNL